MMQKGKWKKINFIFIFDIRIVAEYPIRVTKNSYLFTKGMKFQQVRLSFNFLSDKTSTKRYFPQRL